jgi:hypothetical protein
VKQTPKQTTTPPLTLTMKRSNNPYSFSSAIRRKRPRIESSELNYSSAYVGITGFAIPNTPVLHVEPQYQQIRFRSQIRLSSSISDGSSFLSALRTSKRTVGTDVIRHETISDNFSESNLQNYQPIEYYNTDELPNEAPTDDKYLLETVILLISILSILLGHLSS